MPVPTAREARLALRLQAVELLGMVEGTAAADPEAADARARLSEELAAVGGGGRRGRRLRPRARPRPAVAAGASRSTPGPARTCSTSCRCRRRSATRSSRRTSAARRSTRSSTSTGSRRAGPWPRSRSGSRAHAAFEAFTKERRERLARGEPPPGREDLERLFQAEWPAGQFGDQTTEETYQRRVGTLLDNFYEGELEGIGQAEHEELPFELTIEPADGSPPFTIRGQIDRIDRLPSGGIEVIDYKTGRIESQKDVDESLQLSIYALACRDALGPRDAGAGDALLHGGGDADVDDADGRAAGRRARGPRGSGGADPIRRLRRDPTPSKCWRCDYAPMCPARAR